MAFGAKVLADSLGLTRLTTMELTYPRMIHSEFMTHRQFSRNAASSRAIPIEKMITNVKSDPVIPIHWGKSQKGMQAYEILSVADALHCQDIWLSTRDEAIASVEALLSLHLHKQIANRLLEPWMWITIICTGNEGAWNNFFALRCHHEAEPHIQKIAYLARDVIDKSEPKVLEVGDWHLPLIGFSGDESLPIEDKVKVSVGRCARVSYLTHMGERDTKADIELHDRLMQSKHFSPFEHVAMNTDGLESIPSNGNFGVGWFQYRKKLPGEYQYSRTNGVS